MKKLILLLLLLGNMCMLNAQTVYPPSKPNHIDGSIPSSLLFTWKEGKPASSKEIKYDNGSPIASSQLTSPYRLDQTLFAVRFTTAENTTIERIHAYISFFNEASATFTVRIVGMDENELPDMNNVKATFTQTASVPNYGISSWVELCPSSQISINAQDTIFVVLTANKDVRLHNDIEGSGQGTSFMKRNLDTYFMDIENATMRNANWMIRLQTNHTLASAPSKLDGYNFYKNGTKLNTSLISVPQYQENGISTGSYNYTVKAVYGGAETQASEVLSLNYKATIVYTFENLATGEIPEGCIIIDGNNDNFKLSAQMGGVGGAASYTGSMFLGTSAAKLLDEAFIMPYVIPTAEDHIISLWAKASAQREHTFQIKLSTTGRDTASFTTLLKDSVLTTTYSQYSCDLSAYIGQKISLGLFIKTTGTLTMRPMIDDIVIPPFFVAEKDVTLLSAHAAEMAIKGKESIIWCVIKNIGEDIASDVKINLIDLDANHILAASSGAELKIDSSKTISINWIPTQTGTLRLKAVVSYPDDTEASNDSSNVFYIHVQDTNMSLVHLGQKAYTNYNHPIFLAMKNSGSETIYFPQEINRSGTIAGITLSYSFIQDVLNQPLTIWMGETKQNSLEKTKGGYINPAQLTKVFDGNVDFYAAQNSIAIPFDSIYAYNCGNLVIAFQNSFTEEVFSNQNVFYTTGSLISGRTSLWNSNTQITSFEEQKAIAENNQVSGRFPDIYFIFDDNLTGTLKGTINDENNQPLDNVTVSLNGTDINVKTDISGLYEIPYINEGTYTLTVSRYPYETIEKEITIAGKEVLVENFSMVRLPTIDINGVVIDSITQTPVANAYISIDNNEDKLSTTTDNDGKFIFETVLAKQKYTLNIIADNYVQYYRNITADTNNISLGNVKLQYNLTPAVGVTLDVKGSVILNWDRAPMKNGFFEDFEKYEDFTLDFTPFRTIDVDQYKTGSFQTNNFPHKGEAMSYIVFNSKKTSPAVDQTFDGKLTYSGDRIASAFFPYDNQRKPATVNNNDWLITPQVYVDSNASLQFEARSFRTYDGRYEKFKILISTTSHKIEDFVEIAQCDSTPVSWTHFSYDLSAYKGQHIYAAIQCVSYDVQMFMVDNIRIMNSRAATEPEFVNYKVYRLQEADMNNSVNWTFLGETTEKTYVDNNVQLGVRYAIVANYTENRTTKPAFSCAVSAPVLRVSRDSLNFENITVNTTSAPRELIARGFNLTEKLTCTLSGTGASAFAVTPDVWDSLAGGTLLVTFTPTEAKYYNANLVISSSTLSKTITLKGKESNAQGISDIEKGENAISVYPNPVSSKATINAASTIAEIQIYNNAGQLVKTISGNKTLQQICDFSDFVKGTYHIKVKTADKKISTVSIIVQ